MMILGQSLVSLLGKMGVTLLVFMGIGMSKGAKNLQALALDGLVFALILCAAQVLVAHLNLLPA